MIKIEINNMEYLEIIDEITGDIFYGCNQEWYKNQRQKRAGCGPTVATNIILYANKHKGITKGESLEQMEVLWDHVTPTMKGVNTTNIFYEGLLSYTKKIGGKLFYDAIDIPMKKQIRPSFDKVIDFIAASLKKDIPIAFLNLCNGKEKCLDRWHWVTLTYLEYKEDLSGAKIGIFDEGLKKTIDLHLWYNTTTLGGGLVSFSIS